MASQGGAQSFCSGSARYDKTADDEPDAFFSPPKNWGKRSWARVISKFFVFFNGSSEEKIHPTRNCIVKKSSVKI
jgi:hypothetical protein